VDCRPQVGFLQAKLFHQEIGQKNAFPVVVNARAVYFQQFDRKYVLATNENDVPSIR